ncbi:MAG TPA: SpoIIE family protein phosphatase [Deltaproteobacteria bacterium]|nr:SpoIIE family protein phosphatase [Deltaproteobacteria bacterium]HPP79782.1 SpoIIE family protein phosphatase [Deltaproteobacteria bacterium]
MGEIRNILIIDPDKRSGDLSRKLRRKGFQAAWAKNVEDALSLVMDGKPDLVLFGLDGIPERSLAAIGEIGELSPGTVVVAAAASAAEAGTAVECMRRGTMDLLFKPVTPGALLECIRRIERRLNNLCIGMTPNTGCVAREHKTLVFPNEIENLPYLINQAVLNAPVVCRDVETLKMALSEILINAIEHGNLEITMEEKASAVKKGAFEKLVHRRLADPRLSSRRVTLEVFMDEDRLEYVVTDEGRGFDYRKEVDPDPNAHIGSGLGIQIARAFFHEVRYEGEGNRVHLVYYRDPRLHRGGRETGPASLTMNAHRPVGGKSGAAGAGDLGDGVFLTGTMNIDVIVQLAESFPMGLLLVTDSERIAMWNQKAEQITSITSSSLVGAHVSEAPAFVRHLLDQSSSHADLVLDEFDTRIYEKTMHTVEPREGRRFSVVIFSDVTSSLRQREELERLLIESAETRDLMEEQAARLAITLAEMDEKNEIIRQQNQRMIEELEMAARLQKSLLPDTFENLNGVSFSCKYIPSIHIGGDLYDVVDLGGGQSGFIIADVSGHGVAAALVSAMFKMSFHALASTVASPTILMHMLNKELRPVLEEDYITAFFVITDRYNKGITYTNAGHPTPLLFRRATGMIEELDTDGFFLGSFDDGGYEEKTVSDIEKGDALLMYTDCILEAENPEGEQYGKERLKACFARCMESLRGNEVIEAIEADVRAFAAKDNLDDDLTVLLLEFWEEVGPGEEMPADGDTGGFVEF